jgi:hypothetical protein
MDKTPLNDRLAMTANVQGFELPRGCLMTSVFILLPILAMVINLIWSNSLSDVIFAILKPAGFIVAFVLAGHITALVRNPQSHRP